MREVRYLTDDRDKTDRNELVLQHGGNGDLYISVVPEGGVAIEGIRLATSGGAGYKIPDLVYGLMTSFNQVFEKAVADPAWAKAAGISVSNNRSEKPMPANTVFVPDDVIRQICAMSSGIQFIDDQKFGHDEIEESAAYRNASYFDRIRGYGNLWCL